MSAELVSTLDSQSMVVVANVSLVAVPLSLPRKGQNETVVHLLPEIVRRSVENGGKFCHGLQIFIRAMSTVLGYEFVPVRVDSAAFCS